MAAFPVGLCQAWTPLWCCTIPTTSTASTGTAVAAATEVLWQATGQRFGLCEVTVRPCRRDCADAAWPEWAAPFVTPTLTGGQWVNITCGGCAGSCSCTVLHEAVLPAPVYDVTGVTVDGTPMAAGTWRVDDNRLLVRVDGGAWPACQRLDLADTQPGTWSVTARYGEPVPTLGQQAVAELACEILRACAGENCLLPANVQQLVRQGVSITLDATQSIVDRLYFCGLFVQTYNPHKLPGRARVYDVDGPGMRRAGT